MVLRNMLIEHYVDMVAVVERKIGGKQANNLCLALGFDKWRCMVIVGEFDPLEILHYCLLD